MRQNKSHIENLAETKSKRSLRLSGGGLQQPRMLARHRPRIDELRQRRLLLKGEAQARMRLFVSARTLYAPRIARAARRLSA
jgi:hypothetical protein